MTKTGTSETGTKSAPRMIWKSSGLHLTQKQKNGWLKVTPELLRAYYARPEVHPVEESCKQEHALFERLMADPSAAISENEITEIADPDAAENYRIILRFRDHLLEHGTVEQAYLALFAAPKPLLVPPVFIDQLVHLILSGLLSTEWDPYVIRAAEIFFREQKVTTDEGQIMFADSEVVQVYSETGGLGGLGGLLTEAGTQMREISLDVLTPENKEQYWDRADQFNFALDFRYTQPGPDAFARVLERWVRHMLGVDVRIQAVQSVRDESWSWHVGLDSHATRILNNLYDGAADDDAAFNSIAGLFRLEFVNRTDMVEKIRGKAVYLGLAMSPDQGISMKPQNLLVNLPLRQKN